MSCRVVLVIELRVGRSMGRRSRRRLLRDEGAEMSSSIGVGRGFVQ